MKEIFSKIGIFLIVSIILFFMTEGVLRVFKLESDNFLVQDAVLGWKNIPDRNGYWVSSEYKTKKTTNSQGYFGKDYVHKKEGGVRRIIVAGDSFVEALQVPTEKNFVSISEKLLNEDAVQERYEVVNLGVTSYGTFKETYVLQTDGLRYEPDLMVLVFFIGNDFDDNVAEQSTVDPGASFSDAQLRVNHAKLWVRNTFATVRYGKRLYDRNKIVRGMRDTTATATERPLGEALYLPEYASSTNASIVVTERALSQLAAFAADAHVPLLVVLIPSKEQVDVSLRKPSTEILDYEKPNRILSDIFERNKIAYVDTLFYLRSQVNMNSTSVYFSKDGHLNEVGHRAVAEVISSYIKEHGF